METCDNEDDTYT
ncbi:hypothetical protein CEXT_189001, partial [Caerostris extrusa]